MRVEWNTTTVGIHIKLSVAVANDYYLLTRRQRSTPTRPCPSSPTSHPDPEWGKWAAATKRGSGRPRESRRRRSAGGARPWRRSPRGWPRSPGPGAGRRRLPDARCRLLQSPLGLRGPFPHAQAARRGPSASPQQSSPRGGARPPRHRPRRRPPKFLGHVPPRGWRGREVRAQQQSPPRRVDHVAGAASVLCPGHYAGWESMPPDASDSLHLNWVTGTERLKELDITSHED